MKGLRGERLASQFREEIYKVISTKLRNRYPSLSAIISVTQADVAPDLKTAKIYISICRVKGKRRLYPSRTLSDSAYPHRAGAFVHFRRKHGVRGKDR